jgi:4-hydroxy-tetrahydrodipicolinate synthase
MARFTGVYPAMPTPLTDEFEIDRQGTRNVVDFLIRSGVHGIAALGSTGECAGLTKEQRQVLLETAIEAAGGRVPVVSGANGTCFAEIVDDLEIAAQAGAAAILVPPPVYYTLDGPAVVDYFEALAEQSRVPIFLYHIPQMTKVPIGLEAVARLARHPNIVGLKDSSGQFSYFQEVARIANETDGFSAFTGSDATLYASLAVGGHGIIGAVVNVTPSHERAIYDAVQNGDHGGALALQHEVNQKTANIRALGTFPAGFKATLAARGLCRPTMTRPIPPLWAEQVEDLKMSMESLGLIEPAAIPAD